MRQQAGLGSPTYDPKLGVWSSPRVVADGDPVPRGGGQYLVGHRYMIGGRSYIPSDNPRGYSAVGMASWYGDAFHGRRTANGEVFDKGSISAAHPTLPLPSYVRVTNTSNGRSMIVRVNDRGPYHGGRVMDVSQRVAEALDFRRAGTARIKIDYVGKASLGGDDDDKLLASLRTDGTMAQLNGFDAPVQVADAAPEPARAPAEPPRPARVAQLASRPEAQDDQTPGPKGRRSNAPLPPARPFDMGGPIRAALPPRKEAAGRSSHAHVAANASRTDRDQN